MMYSLAGQAVAVRVTGDPDNANNGLFYLYSDHLGSASVLQHSDGTVVNQTRYTPFGAYRSGGPTPIIDRGFTGHRHNDDLGLIYMNARYYVSYIYRMLSPDSIVPDPTNPQSFNRYSYVENQPTVFNDPTGHYAANVNGAIDHCYDLYQCQNSYTPSSADAKYPEGFANAGYLVGERPDAIGAGVSWSFSVSTIGVNIELNIAVELLRHRETGEIALFAAPGGDASIGFEDFDEWRKFILDEREHPFQFSWKPSINLLSVWNVDTIATDYAEEFSYRGDTIAGPPGGISWSDAGSAEDLDRPEFRRQDAYSHAVGFALPGSGFALSVDQGANYYVPLLSYMPGEGFADTNFFSYIPKFFKWLGQ